MDFIAKLTLHIPNCYQNIRRYAGFYSSNIQRKVRLAKPKDTTQPTLEVRSPVEPKWVTLIAKVFGEIPIACPRCGTAMDLKEFIFDVRWITKVIPELSRAPPKVSLDRNVAENGFAYLPANDLVAGAQPETATTGDDGSFNQTVPENDGFFNHLTGNVVAHVLPFVDVVSMDIKLPSSTGEVPRWGDHTAFLRAVVVASGIDVYVKMVVTAATTDQDIEESIRILTSINRYIPLVIQPASPTLKFHRPIEPDHLESLKRLCSAYLTDVRVVPQMHRQWGAL